MRQTSIILFDGVCNLCNGAVSFVIQRDPDKHFKFAPLQSPQGQALSRVHQLSTGQPDTFLLIQDGTVYTRSTAALRVARRLKRPWPAAGVLRIIPAPWRDWVYDLVAKYRYRVFGERAACMAPTADVRDRFLT